MIEKEGEGLDIKKEGAKRLRLLYMQYNAMFQPSG